jgi:phosphate/sulfate permease
MTGMSEASTPSSSESVRPHPFVALLGSRKFYVGMMALLATAGAITLRVFDKIPADTLTATILSINGVGVALIGAIAWEDTAKQYRTEVIDFEPDIDEKS